MSYKSNTREGLLKTYNLWDLWDELGASLQNKIIESFKSKPLMWDFNDLFNGKKAGSVTHGSINILTTIFEIDDLEFCDLVFQKFKSYKPENYTDNSDWGNNWLTDITYIRSLKTSDYNSHKMHSSDIYWADFHFFLNRYSKAVYKNYLKGFCSIERFENSFELDFNNIDKIKNAITLSIGWEYPPRNPIVDQYLIYLEKQKRFDDCINLINKMRDKGWRNEFEKRLIRCESKKIKNGNKS